MEYPNTTHVSPHFTWAELGCRCGRCGPTPLSVRRRLITLVAGLEALRRLAGAPLHVTSAYRCPVHNQAVGGVPNSQHTQGTAVDLTSKRYTPAQLAALAEQVPAFKRGGIGIYPGFTHVDTRTTGPARWDDR